MIAKQRPFLLFFILQSESVMAQVESPEGPEKDNFFILLDFVLKPVEAFEFEICKKSSDPRLIPTGFRNLL